MSSEKSPTWRFCDSGHSSVTVAAKPSAGGISLCDNGSFDYDYTIEENYAFSSFGGEVDDPKHVRDVIINAIKNYKIQENDFNRIKFHNRMSFACLRRNYNW